MSWPFFLQMHRKPAKIPCAYAKKNQEILKYFDYEKNLRTVCSNQIKINGVFPFPARINQTTQVPDPGLQTNANHIAIAGKKQVPKNPFCI